MAEILILGAGAMGSAFCFPAADAGNSVRLVGTHLDLAWIRSVRETGVHPKLRTKLPEQVIPFTHDQLGEALRPTCDLIVLGVSSAGIAWAVDWLAPLVSGTTPILLLTKGLQARENTLQFCRVGSGRIGSPRSRRRARRSRSGALHCRRVGRTARHQCDRRLVRRGVVGLARATAIHALTITFATAPTWWELKSAPRSRIFMRSRLVMLPALWREGQAENGALEHNLPARLFTQALIEMTELVNFLGGAQASVMGLAGAAISM